MRFVRSGKKSSVLKLRIWAIFFIENDSQTQWQNFKASTEEAREQGSDKTSYWGNIYASL